MQEITLTREELYNLVWSTPARTLIKNYDISDNAFRKTCMRLSIPTPKAGYWENLRLGKSPDRFKLPENYTGEPKVTFTLSLAETPHKPKDKVVPDKLIRPHRLIVDCREYMTREKQPYHGVICAPGDYLDINASAPNIARALRFMDALIKRLEEWGHQIEIETTGYGQGTYAVVSGEKVKFRLREKTAMRSYTGEYGSTEYVPTGQFYLKLGRYSDYEWKDGSKLLEERLPEIVARIEMQGKKLLDERVRREERRKLTKKKQKSQRLYRSGRKRNCVILRHC
jgi:hypothetical protein